MRVFLIPLILLAFPLLELLVMVLLVREVGGWLFAWLALTLLAGVLLVRQERFAVAGRLLAAMREGGDPFIALLASGRMMLAGLLLAFPGVISDALALLILLWPWPKRRERAPTPEIIEGQFRRED